MRERKDKKRKSPCETKCYCSVCGCEIGEDEFEDYDGMCWECWDDQLSEELDDMFGDVI
ncbi:MAG: hypothetical protein QXD41_01190 [Nitrososphaeria archaeon]